MVYKPNDSKYIMPRSNFVKAVNRDIIETNQKLLKYTNQRKASMKTLFFRMGQSYRCDINGD